MPDCLIVGGGVIGLSLAYELAGHGATVRLIDSAEPGAEASWAGAGLLPPASDTPATCALERFAALSNKLHAAWHAQLREETGIDNGYRRSGGIYVAREAADEPALRQAAADWRQCGIDVEELADSTRSARIEPGLCPGDRLRAVYYLPDECQIRNPRHVRALVAGCLRRKVEISSGVSAHDFVVRGGRVEGVQTSAGLLGARQVCLTAGAWTSPLAGRIAPPPPIRPVRGQIALVSLPRRPLERIVNEGRRYLVPRDDGRVLIGSTEEDAGFDRSTTATAIRGLLDFGIALCPALAHARLERCWAGLRPGSADGLPYLGRMAGCDNAFLAAGHGRRGLQLSTGTAVVMARLMRGEPAGMDLEPFRTDRHART